MNFHKRSIVISYLVGLPVGLITIFIFALSPSMITGEGLATMVLGHFFLIPIIGFVLAFIFSLWYSGKQMANDIEERKSLMSISFNHSKRVNMIIWSSFTIISFASNYSQINGLMVLIPLVLFLICLLLSSISISLLISYIVRLNY